MKSYRLLCSFLVFAATTSWPQTPDAADTAVSAPKTGVEWLRRAYDELNIRMPGSPPFHLRVAFHAYPGEELLKKGEEPEVLTGQGVYEETWLGPHHWRREVTFAEYHAVEVESDKGRKIQASSDYEPKRVLSLIGALTPISHTTFSGEFVKKNGTRVSDGELFSGARWKLDHVTAGGQQFVRVRVSENFAIQTYTDGFYFLPGGLPVMGINDSTVTTWASYVAFAGKFVPQQIGVKVGGQDILTATVTIGKPGQAGPEDFDLPVTRAAPGTTLLPILIPTKIIPQLSDQPVWMSDKALIVQVSGVIDRNGNFREPEVILPPGIDVKRDLRDFPMKAIRKMRWRPGQVDGNPDETMFTMVLVGKSPQMILRR